LYLQGKTQRQIAGVIAEKFGFGWTQYSVHKDLKALRAEWRSARLSTFEAKVNAELAILDQLEMEAWAGWERSVGTYITESTKNGKDGIEVTTKTEELAGDPRFLDQVQNCVKKRCEILGLNAPVKSTHEMVGDFLDNLVAARRQKMQVTPKP